MALVLLVMLADESLGIPAPLAGGFLGAVGLLMAWFLRLSVRADNRSDHIGQRIVDGLENEIARRDARITALEEDLTHTETERDMWRERALRETAYAYRAAGALQAAGLEVPSREGLDP